MPKNNPWNRRSYFKKNYNVVQKIDYSKPAGHIGSCSCSGCKVKITVKYAGQR